MNAIIYPIHLRRKFEQRRAARMTPGQTRCSPPEGTDTCVCGHTVVAPSTSAYAPNEVVNHWQCAACGRQWETSAPGHG